MNRLSRAKNFYRQQSATSDAVSPPPATTVKVLWLQGNTDPKQVGVSQTVAVKTLDPLAFALLESVPELPKPKAKPVSRVGQTQAQAAPKYKGASLGAIAGGFLSVAGGLLFMAGARGAK